MTVADWLKVMRGEDDECLAYADWLEEQGLAASAAAARKLPELAVAIRGALARHTRAIHAELACSLGDGEAGWRVCYPSRAATAWKDAGGAVTLVAWAAYNGDETKHSPAKQWIQEACGLRLTATFSQYANPRDGVKARFEVKGRNGLAGREG